MFSAMLKEKNAASDTGSSCQMTQFVLSYPTLVLILCCSGPLLCSALCRDG